jgi:uncharacterized phage protein gp47/JayE
MSVFFSSLGDLGLESSQSAILQSWLAAMQAAFPGYTPAAGNLEFIQAQIFASYVADLATQCSSGANSLFRTFGTDLVGVPFEIGNASIANVQVTAVDTAGYTLPVGTQVTLTLAGAPIGFTTSAALTIPAGQSQGTVQVAAIQPGSAPNGAGAPVALVDPINWVTGISLVTSASGGVDPEDDDHYQLRLAQALQLLAPRPITASDYAALAPSFTPAVGTDQEEVGRATAIDGYDPLPGTGVLGAGAAGSGTYGNEREITVGVTDATGNPLNTDTLTAVQAWLTSLREVNFIVNVVSPSYTTVYVACQVKAAVGWTPSTVQANVQAALLNYLSPANWGLPPAAVSTGWTNYQTVFRSRVESVIQTTQGVDHVVTGTLAVDVNSNPTNTSSDAALPGPIPMPVSTTNSIPLAAIQVSS